MKQWKKRLAALMAVLLLVSLLPTAALAAEETSTALPTVEEQSGELSEDRGGTEEASAPNPEDGTIQPDEDFGGMDPKDEEFGGFEELMAEPAGLKVWIDGEAYELINVNAPQVQSLGKLPNYSADLDLSKVLPEKLRKVEIEAIQNELPESDGKGIAVWIKYGFTDEDGKYVGQTDSYTLLKEEKTLDLFTYGYLSGESTMTLDLILGTNDQLDPDNIRYFVTVHLPEFSYSAIEPDSLLSFKASKSTDEAYQVVSSYSYLRGENLEYTISVYDEEWTSKNQAYLFVEPNRTPADPFNYSITEGYFAGDEYKNVTLEVYPGTYKSVKEITDAGAKVLEDFTKEPGHLDNYNYSSNDEKNSYTVVFKQGEATLLVLPTTLNVSNMMNSLWFSTFQADNNANVVESYSSQSTWQDNRRIEIYPMREGYAADQAYKLRLGFSYAKDTTYDYENRHVLKAVEGLYETLEAAKNQPDIKEDLLSNSYNGGYRTRLDGDGKSFTVFDEDEVPTSITVKAVDPLSLEANGLYTDGANGREDILASLVDSSISSRERGWVVEQRAICKPGQLGKNAYYLGLKEKNVEDVLQRIEKAVELTSSEYRSVSVSNRSNAQEKLLKEKTDIKDQLFSSPAEGGYKLNSSETRYFAILDTSGAVYKYKLAFSGGITISFDWIRDSEGNDFGHSVNRYTEDGVTTATVTVSDPYKAADTYCVKLEANIDSSLGEEVLSNAYVGHFTDLSSVTGSDIKDKLFGEEGYEAVYNLGVEFTIFDASGTPHYFRVKTAEVKVVQRPTPLSRDTYFNVYGVNDRDVNVMPYDADSYYYNGFQTLFVLTQDGGPVADGTEIVPRFTTGNKVRMYAGLDSDGTSGTPQKSGETPVKFKSGDAIEYSAAAENETHLKNYWVTFLTQQKNGKLYVNGINDSSRIDKDTGYPTREVFLTPAYGNHHDIFIANIGDSELTDMSVTLSSDAENIKLDEYWTIQSDGVRKLAPFTAESFSRSGNEADNIAKIRLLPETDESGVMKSGKIKGTLTIKGGGETINITLTGSALAPKITTTSLLDGVKYVPYSSVIQTNNMYGTDNVVISLTSGTLPAGVTLHPNGELYGVPKAAGDYPITVQATYTDPEGMKYRGEAVSFTLHIADNTNVNVWEASDRSYELKQAIINEDGTVSDQAVPAVNTELTGKNSWNDESQVFWSYGPFEDFQIQVTQEEQSKIEMRVFLDSEELTPGKDYTAEEGSTVITVMNQTLKSKGNGSHTIAAEFRMGGQENGTLKRTAQNYTLKTIGYVKPSGGGSGGSSSGSGSSGTTSSNSTTKPATTPTKPTITQPTVNPPTRFTDVPREYVFYPDVEWAFEQGLMLGVSDTEFRPKNAITQGTIVLVLSRLANVKLDDYDPTAYDNIPNDAVYAKAAVWATQAGLLPDNTEFDGQGPISRANMAIMLVKYLRSLGVDTAIPENPISFADAGSMSQEANNSFQVLYRYGIFKGTFGTYMEPAGTTTRAQFSALMHRMSTLLP